MNEYTFYVTETNNGVIEVKANSPEEALERARTLYEKGMVSWGDIETNFEKASE